MEEEWKVIENTNGRYKVSNMGRVWDDKTGQSPAVMNNGGYLAVNILYADGKRSLEKIHRLVMLHFIPNPTNEHKVDHLDGNLHNNVFTNLAWRIKRPKVNKERKKATFEVDGVVKTIDQLVEETGRPKKEVYTRIKNGWTIKEVTQGFRTNKGVQTDTHWFPSIAAKRRYYWIQDCIRRKKQREEREQQKLERQNYKKYGVGAFENSPIVGIKGRVTSHAYRVWDGMLSRCYNPANTGYKCYGALGVTVCQEWYSFQNFAEWYESQYYEDGWHIDKDILSGANKLYSPETCCLVPREINTFFASLPSNAPVVRESSVGFYTQVTTGGNKTRLYDTTKEGLISKYCKVKEDYLKEITTPYKNKIPMHVYSFLIEYKISYGATI